MYKALKFVQGAVAKKDLVPLMTHFQISDGHVRAFNGQLALSSPIAFDIDCKPKAKPLVNAIGRCNDEDTITLSLTDSGKLLVQSGNFRVYVECAPDEENMVLQPKGEIIQIDGEELYTAIGDIAKFMGSDASRPWTNGMLMRGKSLFATNNVIIVERWLGTPLPFEANVPDLAINEMLRVKEPPSHVQLSESSITFHYDDEKWIFSQLYVDTWPDVSTILELENNAQEIDLRIFDGLEAIKPFLDKNGKVIFRDEKMSTHPTDLEGAAFDLPGSVANGAYQHKMLSLLKDTATKIDMNSFPSPSILLR